MGGMRRERIIIFLANDLNRVKGITRSDMDDLFGKLETNTIAKGMVTLLLLFAVFVAVSLSVSLPALRRNFLF
jgi:hypothetical protein